jgi:hypothetical protein
MSVPAFFNRGQARLAHHLRDRLGSRRSFWGNPRGFVPASVWIAAVAAAAAVGGLVLVGPLKDPSKFYGVAAEIMPAFLIAVAVQRSLLDSLGTKADFARVRRDETADSYSPRGLDKGVRNVIEFALVERTKQAVMNDLDLLRISVGPADIAKAAIVGNWDDDVMFWRVFRGQLHDEFGLPEEDPDFFDPPEEWVDPSPGFEGLRESALSRDPGHAIRLLASHAALREDPDFRGGTVGAHVVAAELKRLFAAQHEAVLQQVLSRVTYRATRDYDRRLAQRAFSLRVSIVLLATTEFLALAGLMSPGRPYSGLFVVTAAGVASSIMNVAGGAFADLADSRLR